jgi:predicted aminopeptidase
VTVEEEGLRRWLMARGRGSELEEFLARRAAFQSIVNTLSDGRDELDRLYQEPLAAEVMGARKREVLAALGENVRAIERQHELRTGYDAWIDAGLNNAHLASVATYSDCVPGFRQLLAQQVEDLSRFYTAVRKLKNDPPGRRALCAVKAPETETH